MKIRSVIVYFKNGQSRTFLRVSGYVSSTDSLTIYQSDEQNKSTVIFRRENIAGYKVVTKA